MHDTEDPTRSSAADAAGMAADYSARATYARGYEDGLRAAQAEIARLRPVVDAARNIRHWHDTLRGEGMVVSSEAVRILWTALAALDAVPGDALGDP